MDGAYGDSSAAAGEENHNHDQSAAPGGDYNHSYAEHQQYNSGPEQDPGNQQPGGGTQNSAEMNGEFQQNGPQQGAAYPPQQNYQPNGGYAGNTPPAYNPAYRPPNNISPGPPTYPPAGPAYPPNASPAPAGYPHTPAPQQQAVPPVRPPPSNFITTGNVVPFQQAIIRPELGPPVPWTSELFGFFEDCYGCPLVIIAPCVTFGQIAEIVDTGYNRCQTAGIIYTLAFFLGIPCLYSYTYRTKMRLRFNLREDPLDDFCTHFWCEWCALAQEYRELRYRNIDPALGYDLQRDAIQRAMEAPVPPRMQTSGAPQPMQQSYGPPQPMQQSYHGPPQPMQQSYHGPPQPMQQSFQGPPQPMQAHAPPQ